MVPREWMGRRLPLVRTLRLVSLLDTKRELRPRFRPFFSLARGLGCRLIPPCFAFA